MVKLSIMKRIEAVEQWAKQSIAPATLIMIHFDSNRRKWSVTEHYAEASNSKGRYKTQTSVFDRLQDYCFPVGFKNRVILNTFGCDDPEIHENLFTFDAIDVYEELETDDVVTFAIQEIKAPPEGDITGEMTFQMVERKI